ncbi:hypothetical protein KCU76_g68, partial [Aureobasidium melanogenum]
MINLAVVLLQSIFDSRTLSEQPALYFRDRRRTSFDFPAFEETVLPSSLMFKLFFGFVENNWNFGSSVAFKLEFLASILSRSLRHINFITVVCILIDYWWSPMIDHCCRDVRSFWRCLSEDDNAINAFIETLTIIAC